MPKGGLAMTQSPNTYKEAAVKHPFVERRQERRVDPVLATLVDVAIAYRLNLGDRVAAAFMRETGVPSHLAQRVLEGSATMRTTSPRRCVPYMLPDRC